MLRDLFAFVGRLRPGRVLLLGLFCAVILEAATVVLRFGANLQSTRDTGLVGTYTWGLRIHHGYLALLPAPAPPPSRPPPPRTLLLTLAVGLFVSALFHPSLALGPPPGSPHFALLSPPVLPIPP